MSNLTGHTIAPPALEAWFAAELAKTYAREPAHVGGMIMGCPVWGPKYLAIFAKFCLPSLLAPANRKALLANSALVVLFTDVDGLAPLWRAVDPLDRAGIKYQICPMPPEILAGEHVLHKFMVVGAVHNLLVQWAKRSGRGFHPLYPDHLYSARYFEGIATTRHDAIAHGAVSVDVVKALREIATYQNGPAIEIPARALGDIGFRFLHPQMQACLIKPGDALPQCQTLIWAGKDALHFAGPIFNPVWLSPRLCREAPVLFPMTFDVEIPSLTGGAFHIPGPDEGMVLVELSGKDKAAACKVSDATEWLNLAWLQMNYQNKNLAVFRRRTGIPMQPNPAGLDVEAIDRHHTGLMDALPGAKMAAMEAYFQDADRNLRPFLRT